MAISLTFDAQGFYNDLMDELLKAMNDLINEFYREATSGLNGEGKSDSEVIPAYISDTTEHDSYMALGDVPEYVTAKCKFYANALMQSFGTGSLSDTGPDSYWDEYTKNDNFNKERGSNKFIAGRKKGQYTNIYGLPQNSGGRYKGENIEGFEFSGLLKIEPISPSHSIQNAERWVIKNGETKIERRIETVVTKFITERASSYFREVTI
ncbi:MAG: hypothetical protein K2H20_02715 [Bacilli bacterium]|nr:hypothetical protein [Bacilli bacterium]